MIFFIIIPSVLVLLCIAAIWLSIFGLINGKIILSCISASAFAIFGITCSRLLWDRLSFTDHADVLPYEWMIHIFPIVGLAGVGLAIVGLTKSNSQLFSFSTFVFVFSIAGYVSLIIFEGLFDNILSDLRPFDPDPFGGLEYEEQSYTIRRYSSSLLNVIFRTFPVICFACIGLAVTGILKSNSKLGYYSAIFFVLSLVSFTSIFFYAQWYNKVQLENLRTQSKSSPLLDEDPFVISMDAQVQYAGGEQELQNYLFNELNYPPDAWKAGIEGRVDVSFSVDTTGSVQNVKILKSLSKSCDEEAVRLIKNAKWIPAQRGGKKITQAILVPVKFQI